MRITRSVRKLEPYVPGEQPKAKSVVKLNTNENPYPPSPMCAKALADFRPDLLRRYPDPSCSELCAELARQHGARPENVFVGNGSDEVLSVAAKTFVENRERIGSLDPSYSLYKTLAAIRDVKWSGMDVRDAADAVRLAAGLHRGPSPVSLFLWTNPNAPTGTLAEPELIAGFAKRYRGVVIVDEAYADFARANCMQLATAPGNRNLLVMRTFSKSYSLAGLRVGYCVGPADLIAAMYRVKDSYNVDAVAQAVALAAAKDREWMLANVRKVVATRGRTAKALTARGWDVLPSEANFLFARPPRGNAAELFAALRERNIFVRYFKGSKTGDRLRITVGTDPQMKKFLKAIDELTVA